MSLKKIAIALALAVLASIPAQAGSFGVYGSYWEPDDADSSTGYGARIGFEFVKVLEFEFRGTHYGDFQSTVTPTDVKVEAIPLDGGLRVNFLPTAAVNPYIGAGVTYYFLDSEDASIENETGIYGVAGLDFGSAHTRFFLEAMWRKLDATIAIGSFDTDATLDGFAANTGFNWRW